MIGAESIVTKSIPSGEILVGNSAKFKKKTNEFLSEKKNEIKNSYN